MEERIKLLNQNILMKESLCAKTAKKQSVIKLHHKISYYYFTCELTF